MDKIKSFETSAAKGREWLTKQISHSKDNLGAYSQSPVDIGCYYKSPYMLSVHGHLAEAHLVLDYAQKAFGVSSGDFLSDGKSLKSNNTDLAHYHTYTNTWLVMAAQKMGRFEVVRTGWQYIKTYWNEHVGGFTTNQPYDASKEDTIDLITNAHVGLLSLYLGHHDKAVSVGNLFKKFLDLQKSAQEEGFLIRMNNKGELVHKKNADTSAKGGYVVSAKEPDQLYFMLGYPIAFLSYLYQATGDKQHLETGKSFLEYVLTCHDSVRKSHWSHKVAWGASEMARITGDERYAQLAEDIGSYLVQSQHESGSWMREQGPLQEYDQTAEVSIWLHVVASNLQVYHAHKNAK